MGNGNKSKPPPGGDKDAFRESVRIPAHRTHDEQVRKDQGVINTKPIPPERPPNKDQNKK